MTNDDNSIDITGLGKIAKAIPKDGWKKAIDTACETFSDLVSPITKTTAGLGRLVEAKFDSMIDVQKVFAADAVRMAKEKVDRVKHTTKAKPKASVIIPAIESASNETDDNLREIWSNLLANEMLGGQVHPEFPKVLSRLSSHDAITLSEIAIHNYKPHVKLAAKAFATSISVAGLNFTGIFDDPSDFSKEHLNRLGLIEKESGKWFLTLFGEEFVKCVTDPSAQEDAPIEK